jgi:hypothetical protein
VSEKPIEEELEGTFHEGLSRRKALKRIGAGAAIAWSAPILTSLKTPAFAQYECAPPANCVHCAPGGTVCGRACFCSPHVGNGCFCGQVVGCGNTHACNADADCSDLGPTWLCTTVCGCGGGNFCIPQCGTVVAQPKITASGTTAG